MNAWGFLMVHFSFVGPPRTCETARIASSVITMVAASLPLSANAQCTDPYEWMSGTITEVLPVQQANNVRTQQFTLSAPGWSPGEGANAPGIEDGELVVTVCDNTLPFAGAPATGTCASVNAIDTTNWWNQGANGNILKRLLPTCSAVNPAACSGVIGSGNPEKIQNVRGIFTADLNEPTLVAARVQTAPFNCGLRVRNALAEEPRRILDNWGFGFTTFDGQLEDPDPSYTWEDAQQNLLLSTYRSAFLGVYGDPTAAWTWTAWQPGLTLPYTLDSTRRINDTNNAAFDYYLPQGPVIPSRVAYGRINWDFLWHGTCVDATTLTSAWCLPDEHPRHLLGGMGDGIITASSCVASTCNMACPGGTAPIEQQVKYDFRMLSRFVDEAWDGVTVPVLSPTAEPGHLRIRQQSALRVMPYSDYKLANPTFHSTMNPPSFLWEGCGATDTVRTLDAATIPPVVLHHVEASQPEYVDQARLLIDALAGEVPAQVEGALPRGPGQPFTGFDDDPRVHTFDVGLVGTFGEWTTNDDAIEAVFDPPGDGYPGGFDDARSNLWLDRSVDISDCTFPPGGVGWDYVLEPTAWWYLIHEEWAQSFDPRRVIGKFVYSTNAIDPTAGYGRFCYRPADYVNARRWDTGSSTSGPSAAPYNGAEGYINPPAANEDGTPYENPPPGPEAFGSRFDAWLQSNLADDYATFGGSRTPSPTFGRTTRLSYEVEPNGDPMWSQVQFQAEIAGQWADRFSQAAPLANLESYHVLEETIRYSISRRISLFNPKTHAVPAEFTPGPPLIQKSYDTLCSCAPESSPGVPDPACMSSAVERLLSRMGPQLNVVSRAFRTPLPSNEAFKLKLYVDNLGNVPPPSPPTLQVTFVPQASLDCRAGGAHQTWLSWPHGACGPVPPTSLATARTGIQSVPLSQPELFWPSANLRPQVLADYTSPVCAAQAQASALPAPQTAWAYANDPEAPSGERPITTLTGTLTPPGVGLWTVLYRLVDSSMPAEAMLPYDLVNDTEVSDPTEQRWYLLGYLEVTP